MYIHGVTPRTRKRYSFWIEPEQAASLKEIKERDGVPESEQIRRAIDAWLTEKNVRKAAPRRVASRRRA
jgi:hypothetical protein